MKKKMTNKEKTFLSIIIPVVILFFAFNTLPMIKGFIYSLTNYKGYGSYEFVGFRNYIDLFSDARVGKSYLFTFKYALVGTVLVNVLSLIMALGLNAQIRFKSALRGIYFVPNILGGLVVGYIFSFLFTYILPAVGDTFNISWLQNSILASGSSFLLISGCDVKAFTELKAHFEKYGYSEADLVELERYDALCLIKNEESNYSAFVSKLPA